MRHLALALALAGCSAPDYLLVDVRFTPDEESFIRMAAGDWQIATGRRIDLVFGQRVDTDLTSYTSSIVRVTSRNPVVTGSSDPTAAGREVTSLGNSRIVIVVDTIERTAEKWNYTYPDLFRYIAEHELGHWLGLGHINSRTAIMRPNVGAGAVLRGCITAEDTARFCAVTEGCRPETMRGCR